MGVGVGVDLPGSTAEMTAVAVGQRLGQEVKNKVGMLDQNMVNSALANFCFGFGIQTFSMRKSFLLRWDSERSTHGQTDFFPYGYSRPEKEKACP